MKFKQTVVIVGSEGQDGKILYKKIRKSFAKIICLNKTNFDITNKQKVINLIKKNKPSYIYFFAAYHQSSEDNLNENFKSMTNSYYINYLSPKYFLQAINDYHRKCKFFFASSSLIFKPSKSLLNENSEIKLNEYYSFFKYETMKLCSYYRNKKKIYVNVGILFNHESKYRKNNFLSKKIISHAIKNKNGSKKKLTLGNISSRIDWSYAEDVVDAILAIQKIKHSSDYIISSGKAHSIKEFLTITYNYFNLEYKNFIILNKNILKRKAENRIGSPAKLKKITGWKQKTSFEEMIIKLIKAQI
tara:strand:- start:115 stop:1020 length:906 start_codon:yes stop_codon:yes gene_type:complete